MRVKYTIWICSLIFVMAAANMSCDQGVSPVSSELPKNVDSTNAAITGTVNISGSEISGFGSITVGVQNTNIKTTPDSRGDFSLKDVPTGNITMEVEVQNTLSEIKIENVHQGDLIEVVIEVTAGNKAALSQITKSNNNNPSEQEELTVEVRPDKWNTDWSEDNGFSQDELIAKFSGEGFEQINFDSLLMTGPEGDSIEPFEYDLGGRFFIAKFYQYEAISIIPDPQRGDTHTVQVAGGLEDGSIFDFDVEITIVGERPAEEFNLEIRPDKWNTAWSKSEGVILAKLGGEGFEDIIPGSLEMSWGTSDPITPVNSQLTESHFMAKFKQKDAIGLLPEDAQRGDSFDISVSGEFEGGEPFSLEYTITIVH